MEKLNYFVFILVALAIILGIGFLCLGCAYADTASWYSKASCIKEGTFQKWEGRCANGEIFDDTKLVAASWDYNFGTMLKVTNISTGKSVIVKVSDRGPAKRLYKKGRKIDLSKAAFKEIALLRQGVIEVKIEQI